MADNPTNHDLHIMLTKLDGKLTLLLSQSQDSKTWQERHESNDNKRFADMERKISNWNKFGLSLAIVAAFIGAFLQKTFGI